MADRPNGDEALERARADCDANNNACSDQLKVDAEHSRQVGLICGHTVKTRSQLAESRQSETATADDWDLLDVDERSPAMGEYEMLAARAKDSSAGREQQSDMGGYSAQQTIARNENGKNNKNKSNMSTGNNFIVIDHHQERKNLNGALVHLCTALYSLVPLASLLAFAALIYLLLFTKLWFVTVIYYSYLLVDVKTCNRGGRRWEWVYKAPFWRYLAAYFPIRMRHSRKFKLNPSENYILNYHPHGISAFGCVCSFATDALGFSKLFPGIKSRFMVHETSFLVPVMRETFGLRGDCSVNSASFDYILSKKWKQQKEMADGGSGGRSSRAAAATSGNLLALCGGGLAEADLSDMHTLKIVCATRKGFVKKALIHGAHLVPCIAFGENSVFKKVNLQPGSLSHRLETKWYQLFKFKHPIYYGTSFFNSKFWRGIMPFKRPITVCMGDPIEVQRIPEPSQKQIDHFHSLYMVRLKALYEENRDLCDDYDLKIELL